MNIIKSRIFALNKVWYLRQYLTTCLLFIAGSFFSLSYANDGTHLYDASVYDKAIDKDVSLGVGMDAKRDLGLPWVFYYYVAKVQGTGESRFESMPQGIAVNAMDIQFHFSNKSMTKGSPKSLYQLQAFINSRLSQSSAVDSFPDLSAYSPDDLAYQSFLKTYNYEELLQGPAGFGIRLVKTENAEPLVLYAISGQGEVPEELEAIIAESNGSWFGRYRHIIFSFIAALAAIFIFYRLVGR